MDLLAWIGREQVERDRVTATQARGAAATLDLPPTDFPDGTPLPPGWHWFYFQPAVRRSRLGIDGHPSRGGFLPPVSLPRRMWAGGTLRFHQPLEIGSEIDRHSQIGAVEEKEGRTGRLVFVTVQHRITGPRGLALEEDQKLVYRDPPRVDSKAGEPLPPDLTWQETFIPDAVTLFRFSALTFNGHRIHYDHPYATQIEGYPGLVVHAPLTALLMLTAAIRHSGRAPTTFSFRHVAPLFCDQPITLAALHTQADETEVWAATPRGAIATEARVEWADSKTGGSTGQRTDPAKPGGGPAGFL
jgi:3-methylfumaryl-CoA hydratase